MEKKARIDSTMRANRTRVRGISRVADDGHCNGPSKVASISLAFNDQRFEISGRDTGPENNGRPCRPVTSIDSSENM
jgi:hypothetical protein